MNSILATNSILVPAVALGVWLLLPPPMSAQHKKGYPDGVPPVAARKPPKPPSGPTPRTEEGKVDFSGVWVLSGSPVLPTEPSYQPWAQNLYNQRKAAKGKG